MSLRAWIKAARPLAQGNIAPPLILGQALAVAQTERFSWALAGLALGFGILDHLFIAFANDYGDREADRLIEEPTWLSGGSRVLVDGDLSPRALKRAAILAGLGLLAWCGVGALAWDRPHLLWLGGAALALLWAYSLPPLRLSYVGFGELLQGLGVGLVLPLVGFYAQTGELLRAPFAAFAPLVLLGFASNILTALPDTRGDRAAGKQTWPVRRGEARARRDAVILLGVGLMLVTQVGPELPAVLQLAVIGPPALPLLLALRYVRRRTTAGDGAARTATAFVVLALGAITLLHLSWASVLVVAG